MKLFDLLKFFKISVILQTESKKMEFGKFVHAKDI